jgi:hypothetical protein
VRTALSPNASVSLAAPVGLARGQQTPSHVVLVGISTDIVRCRRLNKECRPAETVRRRSSRKPAISRTARLEEKLDGLVSLIKAGAQSGGLIPSSRATTAMDDSTPGGTFDNVQMLTPATDDSTGSPYNLSPSGFDNTGSELSPVKAEEYLTNFQTYKSKYFPLIYIPSTTTASQLRQERPLLWLCIMTVGSKSTSQQQVLGSKIRETIAREMVVQSEKNIDLLLGILIFIWWYSIYQPQNCRICH